MRFLVPVFVFLAVAAFHSALSASLESAESSESAEKEGKVVQSDGLTELKKIDQMEFEAAQKNEAAQVNVTEEQSEDTRYMVAAQDGTAAVEGRVEAEAAVQADGGGSSEAAAHEESESSEEKGGRGKRDAHTRPPKLPEHDEAQEPVWNWDAPGLHLLG